MTAVRQDKKHMLEKLGLVEWFRPGEYSRVEAVVEDLHELGVRHFRTAFSWTDWQQKDGREWFDWLFPRLGAEFELLPSLCLTPPTGSRAGVDATAFLCDAKTFASFVNTINTHYGDHFQWVELGNPLDDRTTWDWRMESSWKDFSRLMGNAVQQARRHGKKPVLSGVVPADLDWLDILCSNGALEHIEALGITGFPGTWDFAWQRWPAAVNNVRSLLAKHNLSPQLWITATGYSTWRHDSPAQAKKLVDVLGAPVERVYWESLHDQARSEAKPEDLASKNLGGDKRRYYLGLKSAEGRPKFAYRIWKERGFAGLAELTNSFFDQEVAPSTLRSTPDNRQFREKSGLSVLPPRGENKPVLITGGAGFIGTNLARHLARLGKEVIILDTLDRSGVERNLESLLGVHGDRIRVALADVRDYPTVRKLVHAAGQIYHFAAQVAVTTSIETPREDFDVNLTGTLNILESMREMRDPPPLLFTSTNKVYGALDDIALQRIDGRYQPIANFFSHGVSEQQALDFHSPYGCSKGAADQYVLDYARSYDLPTAVFRMSCVYGPHQFGTEDQGWVAHFLIRALKGEALTLYGDGHQVRDLLFVEDLVDAMVTAQKKMPQLAGRAFNMGGGVDNSTSLLELLARIERLTGRHCQYYLSDWRLGDQRYYVSDTRLFQQLTGWKPATHIDTGLRRLNEWLSDNLFDQSRQPFTVSTGEGALQHGKLN